MAFEDVKMKLIDVQRRYKWIFKLFLNVGYKLLLQFSWDALLMRIIAIYSLWHIILNF